MKAYKTMLKTEIKLSLRGMDMLIFAVIVPLVILVLIGSICGNNPAFEGSSYTFIQQSFGALASISICAGGLMGLPLVLSDYRGKQILRRFRPTPISPAILLLVELSIYFLYALVSLILLFIVAVLFFDFRMQGSVIHFIFAWLLVMVSMFSVGMMVGAIAKNTKIAGMIASALYFPMLIFSGATLPYEIMPKLMQKVVDILPLTQGIKILKSAVLGLPIAHITFPIIILIGITLICSFVAIKFFKWE